MAAEKKRAETRARLLSAMLAVCASNLRTLPCVEDVIEKARVSRGTFYNHFDSIEEALAALGQNITRLGLLEGESFRTLFTEKWKSTSVVVRVVLTRAHLDPIWASFVLRTRAFSRDPLLGKLVLQDLAEGRASGEYTVPDDTVALDFLRGLLDACVSALHRGVPNPDSYIDNSIHIWLQALGCDAEQAREAPSMSRQFLDEYFSSQWEPLLGSADNPSH